ncbi:MAG: ABC transporter permease [Erysipelotrichaceae bacterium]|jgi:spermidine/putrescine transport system permease protein|nr:ABC transporter permease [Erysipelotrichaceae bacterium]
MPKTETAPRHKDKGRIKRFFAFKRKYLAIPYFAFLILFVIIPILIILVYAFTITDESGALHLSGQGFVDFFTSPTKINVLVVSLFLGIVNTLLCLLIGYPIAYLLANKKVNQNYVLVMLFVMPMWINFVLRTGATRDVLAWMGIYGGQHPYLATLIGLVYNYLPFTILPLYTTMIKLDRAQIEAARDLGCNPVQTFTRSILPQSVPGIVSASEMVFMPTLSSYVISDTLSEGKLTLFGNSIYQSFSQSLWNQGSFMAFIMLVLIVITMFATKKFRKDESPKKGAGLW